MKIIKSLFPLVLIIGLSTSCSDEPAKINDEDDKTGLTITKTGYIKSNETWTADNIYVLSGKVVVDEGVTLTIEKGTIIKGAEGQGSLASALVVDQGAKLIAEGTATNPIIFTSVLDNIAIGQKKGTNLTKTNTGLWGGLIVLGKAPISVSGDVKTNQIEGIPATETYGQYGGTVANDNSGIYKYISIRHGGITIGNDNEINGITLGGVGSGTVIDNIEIVSNQDDAIEVFGGTVNITNILTYAQGDDAIDIDQAWSGTLTNALVIMGADSDSALELDGPEGSSATEAGFTLKNLTLIGAQTTSKYADLRDGVIAKIENVLAYNFGSTAVVKINGADSANELSNNRISFTKWEIVLPAGATIASTITGAKAGDETKFTNNAKSISSKTAATVGANITGFDWTYAKSVSAF